VHIGLGVVVLLRKLGGLHEYVYGAKPPVAGETLPNNVFSPGQTILSDPAFTVN
jgi:hypothetical protein